MFLLNKYVLNKLILSFISLFLIISSFPSYSIEQKDYDLELQRADASRSSDPNTFTELMKVLNIKSNILTTKQKQYLNYLNAYQATYQGDYKRAENIAISILNSNADPLIKFRTKLTIINALALSQDWNKGFKYLTQVLNSLQTISNSDLHQMAYFVTTLFYNQLGQHSLALNYADKLTPKTPRRLCFKAESILLAQLKLKQLSYNDESIIDSINICNNAGELAMSSLIQTYLAQVLINEYQTEKAINLLQHNLDKVIKSQYPKAISAFSSLLAQAYWQMKDIKNTKKYALHTIEQGEKLSTTPAFISAYKILYQVTKQEGDYQKSLEYHVKFAEADKAYMDETKAKHLAYQLAAHKEFENKTHIKLLDEQNQRLTLAKALSDKKQENNLLFIALLMILLAVLAAWAYRSWKTQERLKELAEYDGLTCIYNRRHFVELARSVLLHYKKSEQELSCVVFDLDLFKQVNDNYGHAKGDQVLKAAVEVCRSIGRHNDIFGRLGGEEFGFILPGCSMMIAEDIANKCRKLIKDIDYKALGLETPITASFGVTDVIQSGFELDDLLADADCAMYASKNHGRNQVTVYKK